MTKFIHNELEDLNMILIIFALNNKESFEYAKTLIRIIKCNWVSNQDLTKFYCEINMV